MEPFVFIEHTADIAFDAFGKDLNELFINAAKAVAKTTIDNIDQVQAIEIEHVQISSDSTDQLLIDFLDDLIFFKDTKHLVFSEIELDITEEDGHPQLTATLKGEKIDPSRHEIGNDVKAVTYHDFKLEKTEEGYKVHVLLDI